MPTLHRELTQKPLKPGSLKSANNGNPNLLGKNLSDEKTTDGENNIVPLSKINTILRRHQDPVICKLEPFNICYRFDKDGNMHPLGARRPVRLIRIYK